MKTIPSYFIFGIFVIFLIIQFYLVERHHGTIVTPEELNLKNKELEDQKKKILNLEEELALKQTEISNLKFEFFGREIVNTTTSKKLLKKERGILDLPASYIEIDKMQNNWPEMEEPIPSKEILERCDTANIKPLNIGGITFYDVFVSNFESEIGFVSPDKVDFSIFFCKFGNNLVPLETMKTGYLRASYSKCIISEKFKSALKNNKYLKFELVQIVEERAISMIDVVVCVHRDPKFYYAASCCIYRNDDNIIKQWLAWNTYMGMDHYFLYDHQSTDSTNKILAPYIDKGLITYINWRNYRPQPHNIDTYHVAQDSHVLSCINRYRDKVKWMWLGDTDEFIYPVKTDNFTYLLQKYEADSGIQGIRIRGWRMTYDEAQPLPLIPDPSQQTMLIEPYPLNKSFVEKYQFISSKYSTFKVFAKLPDAKYSAIHDMAGGGGSVDLSDSEIMFLHYRFERYGKMDSEGDVPHKFSEAFERFGHLLKPWYPPK